VVKSAKVESRVVKGQKPNPTAGMRHVALFVADLDAACFFYIDLLGMAIEWQPDAENIYLCSGNDNVALHHNPDSTQLDSARQRLDHIGFIIDDIDDVDRWYDFLKSNDVKMKSEPRTHRDGARSFYCLDPEGTVVQIIVHPPLSGKRA
jgi:catechol 2,3-dioxygenase-like lactoylglutathione lyase family enzyme